MRPYDTYIGGKGASGVHQAIINQIRPHQTYIEPFVGNGFVFSKKRRADTTILNDISKKVAKEWNALAVIGIQVMSKDAILLIQDLMYQLAINAEQSQKFNLPSIRTVMYCDPPYPISCRSQQIELYDYEWKDADHKRFLELIKKLPCDVLVSTYSNPMYEDYLKDWRMIKFQARTRGYTATEVLYMNYPEPTALHDCSYLGKDYRERERIKRKAARWKNKFDQLPALERYKIIELLNQ